MLTATFNPNAKQKFTQTHRKEKGFSGAYLAVSPTGKVVAELRIYWAGKTCSACLWVNSLNVVSSGKESGTGIHKASCAAGQAIINGGFALSSPIDGRGDFAIQEALLAVAVASGYADAFVIHSHP